MKNLYKVFLVLPILVGLSLFWPSVAKAVSQLYITAVQTGNGTGHTTEDFVELFNPSDNPVNIKDYKLVKRTAQGVTDSILKSWSDDIFIPAYSFYLWANANYANLAIPPDATSSGTIADDNGVAVRFGPADTGQILDSVAWGQTNNGFNLVAGNLQAGTALQRQDLYSDESQYIAGPAMPRNSSVQKILINNDPPVENIPTEETPPQNDPPVGDLPTEENPNPPVTEAEYVSLEISEILPNPTGVDTGQEAIELFNPHNTSVSLNGWFLGDGLTSQPASNAYELAGQIAAGEYKAIVIPAGKFSLLNSGGEVVQLFSPNKKVVDSVTYSGTAGENKSFQKLNDSWVWQESSLGVENMESSSEDDPDEDVETNDPEIVYSGIKINEFYSGLGDETAQNASIELKNISNSEIDLLNWKIDVVTTHLKKPSDSVFEIENSSKVGAGGLVTISLSNINSADFEATGKYWVILYSPDSKSQDAVNLKSIVRKLSWAKFGSFGWQWTSWSPALENSQFQSQELKFTEFFPAYKDSEIESFVEIQNPTEQPVYLGNLQIKVGSKSGFLPDYVLQPQEYFAVSAEDLPAGLTTTGKKLSILDANEKAITSISYPKAKNNLAYMLGTNSKWVWTTEPTPNLENVYKQAPVGATKKVTAKANTKAVPKPVAKPVSSSPVSTSTNSDLPDRSESAPKSSKKPLWLFGVLAGVLLLAGIAVWVSSKEPEVS